VRKHDDLPSFGGFLGKPLGHRLHAVVVEGGDRVVDNNTVISADLTKFG